MARGWTRMLARPPGLSERVAPLHACDTCAKLVGEECAVLTARIGAAGDCWAWDDDPAWEEYAEAATLAYAARHGARWPPGGDW